MHRKSHSSLQYMNWGVARGFIRQAAITGACSVCAHHHHRAPKRLQRVAKCLNLTENIWVHRLTCMTWHGAERGREMSAHQPSCCCYIFVGWSAEQRVAFIAMHCMTLINFCHDAVQFSMAMWSAWRGANRWFNTAASCNFGCRMARTLWGITSLQMQLWKAIIEQC